jgi:hypothetical protein
MLTGAKHAAAGRKSIATRTKEQRSEFAKKGHASRTPAARSKSARRGAATLAARRGAASCSPF